MRKLSHLDKKGSVNMVDVSAKDRTLRRAVARAEVILAPSTLKLIAQNKMPKGNVFEAAKIAGIMAAKKTGDIIPLCHPLGVEHVSVDFKIRGNNTVVITAEAKIEGKTGVEMEALTAATVSALTVYDMCKAVDKRIVIKKVCLVEKTGGKSDYKR